MTERYQIQIKVVSVKGKCSREHFVGEQWTVDTKTPAGICLGAFGALFPYMRALMFGGSFPWQDDPDMNRVACPDADNPVVFEVRRIPLK